MKDPKAVEARRRTRPGAGPDRFVVIVPGADPSGGERHGFPGVGPAQAHAEAGTRQHALALLVDGVGLWSARPT